MLVLASLLPPSVSPANCVQQSVIEDGLRQPIGLWLRDHAKTPHDSVMLEPLGYIGYYSGLKMLDYPGLASKEMVAARKRFGFAKTRSIANSNLLACAALFRGQK